MLVAAATAESPTTKSPSELRRGPVLEMLKQLLSAGDIEGALAAVSQLLARNSELEKQLARLRGGGARKNEGISTAQLTLLLEALMVPTDEQAREADENLKNELKKPDADQDNPEQDDETKKKRGKPQPRLRRPLPANLRRIENPICVPVASRPCPTCGALRTCIGHDVTETIELIPAEIVVRIDKREKLACRACEAEVVRAPMADKVVSGGLIGSTLVAQMIVDKYDDGLPLNRQKQRYERLGISLPISTIADQITWATDLLQPLWRSAMARVLVAEVMHLDATGLPVLDRAHAKGIRLGSLWGYVGDQDVAAYLFTSTGKKFGQQDGELGPADVLALRKGLVVADAAGIFDSSFQRDDLVECACNMHARRYFVKALDRGDTRATLPIGAYKRLYEIEEKIRGLAPDERRDVRQKESQPIYDQLCTWADVYRPGEPPSSPFGEALRYLNNHKIALRRFLGDGRIPMDNGIVERLHVRAAISRKNFLFAGSDAGARRAAIALTILGCCRLVGVNPALYLADVLPRLARETITGAKAADLLPATWKTRQL